jgi:HEAT repeat protein
MNAKLLHAGTLAAALLGPLAAGCAQAQGGQQGGLAARVDAVRDGEVRFHFASRPGVCGSVHGISTREGQDHRDQVTIVSDGHVYREGRWDCVEGPVHVALERRGGRTVDVRTRVAVGWEAERGTQDLGRVGVRQATDYLLDLARTSRDGDVGEDAVLPATLADSVTTWPTLLRLARSEEVPDETRRSAVFWVSQQAGEAATRGLAEIVDDDDVDREVREHAVFALSQRPKDEAVPELIRVARSHRDPEIRKKALFWLGQSKDPRALALFEEILSQ